MGRSKLIILIIILTAALMLNVSTVFAASAREWVEQDIVGNWETAAYIDGEEIVLRIASDSERELYFGLRSIMEHLGYEAIWNPESSSISMINNENHIQVFAMDTKVLKNDEEIILDKPTFITCGISYFHQSFISKVLDMEIVHIDRALGERHRVHAAYITTNRSIITAIRNVSETESLIGYITISDNTLYIDEIEIIWDWQYDRIAELAELGMNLSLPNGYYFLYLEREKSAFEITEDTLFVFTDFLLNFLEEENITRLYYTISLDEFLVHLNTSYSDIPPAQKVPFFIEVQNGKAAKIWENFLFTI